MDFKALAAKAAETEDQTEKKSGGGDYTPPAAGPTRLRFVGYVEFGKQNGSFQGKPRVKEEVSLFFELSGPKHPPREFDDKKYPDVIEVKLSKSLNEKSHFSQLFHRMNYAGKAQHFAQLLGEAYKGEVFHRTYKRRDGTEGVAAELNSKANGYSIAPPRYEITGPDGPTGEFGVLQVEPPLSPIKLFLFNMPDMDQWASIFIDGEYEERKDKEGNVVAPARSKNKYQQKVMSAVNFKGSPMHALLVASGKPLDLPAVGEDPDEEAAESPATAPAAPAVPEGQAATDALSGVV